ncbi:ATP-binding protein, partial [Streptomyces sp. DT225]
TEPQRKAVLPAGKGIDPKLRRTLRDELPELEGEDPIAFRWDSLPSDVFFELDREQREVRLNKEYRQVLNGGRRGGLNDAPVIKSMLYLMVNEIFQKERVRAVHTDNVALWN